jgi:hypothetical protein
MVLTEVAVAYLERSSKMKLLETGLSVVDWIGLAQDRYRRRAVVNSVMNLRVS